VNIYTDSKYAFATLLMHGAKHKKRGLLTARGKEIRKKKKKRNPPTAGSSLGSISSGCHALQRPPKGHGLC
jgi:ribonuclease HI